MRYGKVSCIPWAAALLWTTAGHAEGTAQLGANQDLVEQTEIKVDVLTAGEVINIAVGNNSATDPAPVRVDVRDPGGSPVKGSPFYVKPGQTGFLATPHQVPDTVADPLQVVTSVAGTHTVAFDNTRTDMGSSIWMNVVGPFDITVTPDSSTPVTPADPPGGHGRVHSTRWMLNAHGFTKLESSDAAFYVLTPTRADTDHTWLLQFNGIAGHQYDVRANDIGMPPPYSSSSVEAFADAPCPVGYAPNDDGRCQAAPPEPKYEIYLKVPRLARGGSQKPTVSDFVFNGVTAGYECAIPDMAGSFSFTTDAVGRYRLLADLDGDGVPGSTRNEVLREGSTTAGLNEVIWDGKDPDGRPISLGNYRIRLAVRIGEFHFVGQDIETANPGLRVFGIHQPTPSSTPRATRMYWDDSAINDRPLKIAPASPLPHGIDSGAFSDPPVCSAPGQASPNAHCWGDFTGDPSLSPGDERLIDTWVYLDEVTADLEVCVGDETQLRGLGGGGGCTLGHRGRLVWPVLLLLLGAFLALRAWRPSSADRR